MDDLSRWTWARVKALNRRVNLSTEGWLNTSHRCDAEKNQVIWVISTPHGDAVMAIWSWCCQHPQCLCRRRRESANTHRKHKLKTWVEARRWMWRELTKMNEDEEENYILPCLERKWDEWVREKRKKFILFCSLHRQSSVESQQWQYKLKYWMKSRDDCGGALGCGVDMYIVK